MVYNDVGLSVGVVPKIRGVSGLEVRLKAVSEFCAS